MVTHAQTLALDFVKKLHFFEGVQEEADKQKIASFFNISNKLLYFLGISKQIVLPLFENSEIRQCKIIKLQHYRKMTLCNPPPITHCLSRSANKC